jgi:predicted ArsR family transcriptional regulator
MLNAVLREIRSSNGDAAVAKIFENIGKRASDKMSERVAGLSVPEKVDAIAESIRESGVTVDVERQGDTIVLREHTCPYATVVSEHPECCTAIHTVLDTVIAGEVKQTESLATGGSACRFEVAASPSLR